MLMVPLFAIGVWALHPRARRYYAEHLVFSFYADGIPVAVDDRGHSPD